MIKYKTSRFETKITPVEISRETEHFVWIKGKNSDSRQKKQSDWCVFHDNWQQAKDHLIARETRKVESLRLQLEMAKGYLGNVKGLREPE